LVPFVGSHRGGVYDEKCAGESRLKFLKIELMPALKNVAFQIFLKSGFVPLRDVFAARQGQARAIILCYHRIGNADVLTTPPENFQRDLEYLKSHFQCLPLADLCARLKSGHLDAPTAVVTFDDGYRDNFTHGVPLLKAAQIPATFFVSTGFMSTQRVFAHDEHEPQDFPKLTWDDLRTMQNDGFEIGSHTVNHADMGAISQEKLETELQESLATLQRELGERPRAFAFPYGKPRNVPLRAIGAARRAGYYAALSAYGGDNKPDADLFRLRRIDAGNGLMNHIAWQARLAGCDPDFWRFKWKQGAM
jgi:peptidoglycan/xylan/chitin deacetylase (PgdA/CDA1 family)